LGLKVFRVQQETQVPKVFKVFKVLRVLKVFQELMVQQEVMEELVIRVPQDLLGLVVTLEVLVYRGLPVLPDQKVLKV
jgi:hypothetical protein